MNKEHLLYIADSILESVNYHFNLDLSKNYNILQNTIASIISNELNLGIEFTNEDKQEI